VGLAALAIVALLSSEPARAMTLGELAASNIVAIASNVRNASTLLTEDPKTLKPFRKSLLKMRLLIDVAGPAFPNGGSKKKDFLLKIRDDLDLGYETLGSFQDLYATGVNFTEKEATTKYKACVTWRKAFLKNLESYVEFLSNPSTTFYEHKGSKFFWSDECPKPDQRLSAACNLMTILKCQSDNAYTIGSTVVKQDDVYADESQETFHNFRKSLRTILGCSGLNVEGLYKSDVKAETAVFQTLYDDYGDLNDLWGTYKYYQGKTKTPEGQKEYAKARLDLQTAWQALVNKQGGLGIDAVFGSYKSKFQSESCTASL